MKYFISVAIVIATLMSCQTKEAPKSWQLAKVIKTEGVNPIGIAATSDGIWLSDGDHNRLVLINENGAILKSIDSLERPMHISSFNNELIIPQYGNDVVMRYNASEMEMVTVKDSLDAPAGADFKGDEIAIADFYNNRILYAKDGINFISFGKEGKAEGDFYYPTDVQITTDRIWVADAYNNRVQAFDKEGKFVTVIGANEKMNAATGIYVSEKEVFVTDFENNRVLVYDHTGVLQQALSESIEKPTDAILVDGKLYISNYRGSKITVYEWKEAAAPSKEK
ncbi:NHL repeat-containing protein [Ulvibacter sp. MAR_2010_11]|uniref:NHL repeat-containing protein n=1 Tax=Ulvibacter sp. MAR_2010_11 TaxID=1250229 RepID=UPI000C2C0884|nr:NHL repeat-containing protein [Ulvibacter sp. MAR_2010_11]PKA82488.1 NHL repeat-containing protein [Ulvibacter sp. MAR_2010_11]